MAGAWTTKTITFVGLGDLAMRVWDESGVGTGPYSFGHPMLFDPAAALVPLATQGTLATIDTSTSSTAGAFSSDATKNIDPNASASPNANLKGLIDIGLDTKAILQAFADDTTPDAFDLVGGTPYKNISLTATKAQVKGSAGVVKYLHVMNLATTKRYLKIYDAPSAGVTVGTTEPVHTFPIATLATTNGMGFVLPAPINFTTGITIAATTGIASSDVAAPGTNEVVVNLGYT